MFGYGPSAEDYSDYVALPPGIELTIIDISIGADGNTPEQPMPMTPSAPVPQGNSSRY